MTYETPDPDNADQMQRLAASYYLDQPDLGGANVAAAMARAVRAVYGPAPLTVEPTDLAARIIDAGGVEWARTGDGWICAADPGQTGRTFDSMLATFGPLHLKEKS